MYVFIYLYIYIFLYYIKSNNSTYNAIVRIMQMVIHIYLYSVYSMEYKLDGIYFIYIVYDYTLYIRKVYIS
jgi:hypothetical protein